MELQDIDSDALAKLGALALGSRLRRLADTLYRQAAASLQAERIDLAPNHIPVLMTLYETGSMSVAGLARALQTSQPGVTRMLSDLKRKGLVDLQKSRRDQRQSVISLTPNGTQLMAELSTDYCHRIAAAATELFAPHAPNFLEQLAQIETELAKQSLTERTKIRRTQ